MTSRFRFGEFTLSPGRRVLLRNEAELPLIPRYFDLLLFLIERRGHAIHRREIFDRVWSDVIVSESALSQAIRTIRRTLDDDPRQPRFVRTVSRHGYEFVFPDVTEEDDTPVGRPGSTPVAPTGDDSTPDIETAGEPHEQDQYGPLIVQLTQSGDDEERRDAAERLHALGTAAALARLGTAPGHAVGRAILRDVRWDSATAGDVPILGQTDTALVVWHLVRLRLLRASGIAARRWVAASMGGGLAGALGGAVGGLVLIVVPDSVASFAIIPVLSIIGALCGSVGAAGVSAGSALGESVLRSRRALAVILGSAVGGGLVGLVAQWVGRSTLEVLVGMTAPIGGGLDGLAIGGAAGAAYALGTPTADGGLAAPRGVPRVRAVALIAIACGLAALALSLAGRPLVGGTIHGIAQASVHGQAVLTPLGRLIGEPGFGPITAALMSFGEAATFGLGLGIGLTHRPR